MTKERTKTTSSIKPTAEGPMTGKITRIPTKERVGRRKGNAALIRVKATGSINRQIKPMRAAIKTSRKTSTTKWTRTLKIIPQITGVFRIS